MKPKLHIVATVPQSIGILLRGQPRFLSQRFDVTLVCAPGPEIADIERAEGVPVRTVPLTRRITPREDALALAKLTRHFRRTRPDIVQTYTPKAGWLGTMAARAARVPVRVHGIVGMPLMEARGFRASALRATEKLTYACATHLTANSFGLRDWIHEHLGPVPIEVLGHGSINGVDVEHFHDRWTEDARAATRAAFGLLPDDVVFVFVGRLVRDKGLGELVRAFTALHREAPRARLMLVGDPEPELDTLPDEVLQALESHPAIVRTGFATDVRPLVAAADVFVLPSYREGLPNSLLEAGAMGLPSVTTDINGCNEVVRDGDNGRLVPPKDAAALQAALRELLDPERRRRLAARARPSVVERYDQRAFWRRLEAYYLSLLER